ncbi:hypothetical protein [Nitrosomonas communis]|uniref:Uncharacterized protein n=1 Tax=Nitrosomonas communis TaxID=44574 RepID=A0A1I4KE84_9PROT|nr:hypothetical protein [Nitrosomonas communis]SFL77050.1 hypothetical protein SAMN05421863_100420 [Nitrosomonas communis]
MKIIGIVALIIAMLDNIVVINAQHNLLLVFVVACAGVMLLKLGTKNTSATTYQSNLTLNRRNQLTRISSFGLEQIKIKVAEVQHKISSSVDERIETNISVENALSICKKIVEENDWRILNTSQNHIQCKEFFHIFSFYWPIKVEIIVSGDGLSHTTISLHGSVIGGGLIQNRHLEKQISKLKSRIEIMAMRETPVSFFVVSSDDNQNTVKKGVEKLLALRPERGTLTDKEFTEAVNDRLLKGD